MSVRRRGWLTRVRLTALCLVLVWAFACAVSWAVPNRVSVRQGASGDVGLVDDDGDAPLFGLPALRPGTPVSRCIGLRYTSDGGADVRMTAIAGVGRAAAEQIAVRVEAGTGARFGDCRNFAGAPIFEGSLAELTDRAAEWGTALPLMKPNQSASTSLRVTASIDDTVVQGREARVSFAFTARSTVERLDSEPTSLIPEPGRGKELTPKLPDLSSVDDAPRDPTRVPTVPDGSIPPLDADFDTAAGLDEEAGEAGAPPAGLPQGGRTGEEAGAGAGAGTVLPARPARKRALGKRLTEGLEEIGRHITEAAEKVLVRSPFPLALGLMVFGFLGLQNRIDRRDPKLAEAPVFGDPDVDFRDPDLTFDAVPAHPPPDVGLKASARETDSLA